VSQTATKRGKAALHCHSGFLAGLIVCFRTMKTNPTVRSLLSQQIDPSSTRPDGSYTSPRTWGVYEIEPPQDNMSTRRFRLGNHPVRQRELEAEFGKAWRIALFTSRGLALELERQLNERV
jgi:hypothetical protein